MNITDYVELRKQELDDFRDTYLSGHVGNPHMYPIEMEVGDWYDQELTFNSMMSEEEE